MYGASSGAGAGAGAGGGAFSGWNGRTTSLTPEQKRWWHARLRAAAFTRPMPPSGPYSGTTGATGASRSGAGSGFAGGAGAPGGVRKAGGVGRADVAAARLASAFRAAVATAPTESKRADLMYMLDSTHRALHRATLRREAQELARPTRAVPAKLPCAVVQVPYGLLAAGSTRLKPAGPWLDDEVDVAAFLAAHAPRPKPAGAAAASAMAGIGGRGGVHQTHGYGHGPPPRGPTAAAGTGGYGAGGASRAGTGAGDGSGMARPGGRFGGPGRATAPGGPAPPSSDRGPRFRYDSGATGAGGGMGMGPPPGRGGVAGRQPAMVGRPRSAGGRGSRAGGGAVLPFNRGPVESFMSMTKRGLGNGGRAPGGARGRGVGLGRGRGGPRGRGSRGDREDEDEDEDMGGDDGEDDRKAPFMSAHQKYIRELRKKKGGAGGRRGLGGGGARSGGLKRKFVPPAAKDEANTRPRHSGSGSGRGGRSGGAGAGTGGGLDDEDVPEQLRGIEPKLIEMIENEILDDGTPITFEDIAGLDFAKQVIVELVVWPMQKPELFTGLRSMPRGLLLFGPPGTGKTLIGKAVAAQCGATFFSISASSLTSKWVGEGEKMVRTLFAVASTRQPAVIFIDEIDSLLTARKENDNESSRRIKTEFLVQLDGAKTSTKDQILVIGATNRPQELDEAARRRFVKKLYIPLPTAPARKHLIKHLLKSSPSELTDEQVDKVVSLTGGFSGADVTSLCKEAAMGPLRGSLAGRDIRSFNAGDMPPIRFVDFTKALKQIRPSVAPSELDFYLDWNKQFGNFQVPPAEDGGAPAGAAAAEA